MAQNSQVRCSLIIIGGSAGSLQALLQIIPLLKTNLTAAIIIILHRRADPESLLSAILSARTQIAIKEAEEKELVRKGTIYLCPPDYHLLIEKNKTFSLDASEKVNYSRPSIDVTIFSALEVFRSDICCILLSGANDDGVRGLYMARNAGCQVVVQDPSTAEITVMPEKAIQKLKQVTTLTPSQIADYINLIAT